MLPALIKRTLVVFFGSGFSNISLLAFELFLAAELGTLQYGHFAVCFALLMILSSLSAFGLNFGIVQYLAIYQEQEREDKIYSLIRSSMIVVALASLLIGFCIFLNAHLLALRIFKKPEMVLPLKIIGLTIPFEALNQCMSAIFRGLRQFKTHVAVMSFIRNVCLLLSIPFTLWLGLELDVIVYFLLFGCIVAFLVGITRLPRRAFSLSSPDAGSWPVFRELIAFSYLLFFWQILQSLADRFQILLAGIFLTSEYVGIFAILLKPLLIFTLLRSAINQTTAVEFAQLNYLEEQKKLERLFKSIALVLLIGSTLLAIPIVIRPDILMSVFGEEYISYTWMLLILVFVQIFNVGTGPTGQLLISCKKQPHVLIACFIASAIQLTLSLLLMPAYGLAGAVLGRSITIVLFAILRQTFSFGLLRIHCFSWRFLAFGLIGATSILIGLCVSRLIYNLSGFGLGITVAVICYIAFSFAYSFLDKTFQRQILLIQSKLRRKQHEAAI